MAIKERIQTGLVVLPALLLYIYFSGPVLFGFLVFAVSVFALREFYVMSLPPERNVECYLATGTGAVLVLVFAQIDGVLALASLSLLAIFWLSWFLFSFRDLQTVMCQVGMIFLGIVYLSLPLGHLAALIQLDSGKEWVFLILLLTMSSDTAAYFVGVSLGRRKLYPAISPNKSVEGAIGGLFGALMGVLIAKFWFLPILGFAECLMLGLLLGPLAQVGDLVESMLKRSFGVKDSGTLIPGHGGILDRLDSLLLIFPPVYYFALFKGLS